MLGSKREQSVCKHAWSERGGHAGIDAMAAEESFVNLARASGVKPLAALGWGLWCQLACLGKREDSRGLMFQRGGHADPVKPHVGTL